MHCHFSEFCEDKKLFLTLSHKASAFHGVTHTYPTGYSSVTSPCENIQALLLFFSVFLLVTIS